MQRKPTMIGALALICAAVLVILCACQATPSTTATPSASQNTASAPANPHDLNGDGVATVLCFGDSNTWGYIPGPGGRYDEMTRWPCIMAQSLGADYAIIEEGLNGRTTAFDVNGSSTLNGLSALPSILVLDKPIDVAVIMLGTNDCAQRLKPSEIAGGLEKLVECIEETCAKEQGYVPEIIIVSPAATLPSGGESTAPINDDSANLSPAQKSRQLPAHYERIAERHGCTLIVSDAEVSPLDTIHLTEAGHRRVAELVTNALIG